MAVPPLSLDDLVRNRTLAPEMAATLVAAVAERRGLLVAAIPRMAGKTTTMLAALRAADAPLHVLSTDRGPSLGIPPEVDGGYLVLSEIARAPFAEYLWGAPVRHAFEAVRGGGFGLAAALHASGVEEAFDIVTRGNRVPDADAARLEVMVYIRTFGRNWQAPERRVVAAVYEIVGVTDGLPDARLLHHWDEATDRFAVDAAPVRIGTAGGELERARARFGGVSGEAR